MAGRCYLPVDPEYPDQRLRDIAVAGGTRIALSADPERLEGILGQEVRVHGFAGTHAHRATGADLPTQPDPDAPGVMLYTSGSTGRPKGVVLPRKMLLHTFWRRGTACGFSPQDRYAILYISAFMGGVISMLAPLLFGSTICIYDLRHRGLPSLAGWLQREQVTILHMITSILRRFLSAWKGAPALPRLRIVIPGGERSLKSDIELFKSTCAPEVRFCACLGSTECGTLTMNLLGHDTDDGPETLPLGKPFAALDVHIQREDGTRADPGETGEITVQSGYIFRGYHNAPELNAGVLSFTTDGKSVYRTGDFGYLDADGMLYNLGRRDSRVKVRGTLVELAEVESAILNSGLVEEAVVTYREIRKGDPESQLVAFYRGSTDCGSQLGEVLLDRLPLAMIPSHWVRLGTFPQTANGKTDRRALASMPLE